MNLYTMNSSTQRKKNLLLLLSLIVGLASSFAPQIPTNQNLIQVGRSNLQTSPSTSTFMRRSLSMVRNENDENTLQQKLLTSSKAIEKTFATLTASIFLSTSVILGGPAAYSIAATPASEAAKYDGFAEYAKENQMEQSDVGCFINKCGDQTKALFSNPRGIKGVSCLGRCKGEQSCATRCFAEFGSEDLNNWLSCTIEDNECVKVPKNIDNSAENEGVPNALEKFDPKSLIGTWYKTDGLNPNYDLFDCQTNTFTPSENAKDDASELDMGIFFRVIRPDSIGGGYWENALTEHMVVDASAGIDNAGDNPSKRTMHTEGKMYGLKFNENWYIIGESDGKGDIPEFKLVAYKGHTLQGNYEGAFVYAKESKLPEAAKPAVREAAARAGLNFDDFTVINNLW